MKLLRAPAIAFAGFCIFLGSAAASPQGDLETGVEAYQSGEFGKSFAFALKAARANYAPAFEAVAVHYLKGIGVPQDYGKAAFWAKKAASSGRPYGQYLLASLYVNGQGVAQSNYLGVVYAHQAVRGGYHEAEKLIAFIEEIEGANATTCMKYGFMPNSRDYAACVMQLDQAQQQAEFAQQQYQLQLAQYQQQQAAYEAQQAELKKEKDRRRWSTLATFGFGMAASNSPTLAGGMADGMRALNGQPPLPAPVAPTPPPPQNYVLRLPNGNQVYCYHSGNYMSCR